MKFKKLLAGLLTGAMVLGCVPQTLWGENFGQVQAEGTTTDSTVAGTVTAGGVVPGYTADAANDGLTGSYWYAAGNSDTFWYDMEFESSTLVDGIRVLPRTAGSAGVITQYEVWVKTSTDTEASEDWTDDYIKVCSGTWNDNGDGHSIWKTAKFEPVETTNVRIVAVETSGGTLTEDNNSEVITQRGNLQKLIVQSEVVQKHACKVTEEVWATFTTALAKAQKVVNSEELTTLIEAYDELTNAKVNLTARTEYTTEDPFVFPQAGETAVLEAEFTTTFNASDRTDYPMEKRDGESQSSNRGHIADMQSGDSVTYAYTAEAGTYHVIARYNSGASASSKNNFKIQETTDNKITQQTVELTPTRLSTGEIPYSFYEFDLVVDQDGDGTMKVYCDSANGAFGKLDYFLITRTEDVSSDNNITVKTDGRGTVEYTSVDNGSVTGQNKDMIVTVTPKDGYNLDSIKIDGVSVNTLGASSFYLNNVSSNHTIEASFGAVKYTDGDPFVFPATKNMTVTLETEYATSITRGSNSTCQIAEADWASNGQFLSSFQSGDSASYAYYAPVTGIYQVTASYRSGAFGPNVDNDRYPWNTMQWSGDNITSGNVEFANTYVDNQLTVQTVTFEMTVSQAGAGTLVLQATSGREMPQLDKLEIKLADQTANENMTVSMVEFQVTAATEKTSYFKGGSLRMDDADTYDMASMRYEYQFPTTLNGMDLVENQWLWAYCTVAEDNTVAETGMSNVTKDKFVIQNGICYSNLVFVNIAVTNYDRDIYAQLMIPYSNIDDETLVVYTSRENRSVASVAQKVAEYGSTEEQKAYATALLNAMNADN